MGAARRRSSRSCAGRRSSRSTNASTEMNRITRFIPLGVPATVVLLAACGDPQSTSLEYMPDMCRSPAVEAYVDYGQDPFYVGDSVALAERNTPSWRLPPTGTSPFASDQSKAMYNFPYPYADTPEDYERAGAEVHSPVEFTQE